MLVGVESLMLLKVRDCELVTLFKLLALEKETRNGELKVKR